MKINESQLRKIIKESIKKVLNEGKPADRQVGPGVISEEYNSDAFSLMDKVRKCVILNLASEIGGNHYEITRGENNSILVINKDNPSDGVKVSFDLVIN